MINIAQNLANASKLSHNMPPLLHPEINYSHWHAGHSDESINCHSNSTIEFAEKQSNAFRAFSGESWNMASSTLPHVIDVHNVSLLQIAALPDVGKQRTITIYRCVDPPIEIPLL